jgi:hypothetical protein
VLLIQLSGIVSPLVAIILLRVALFIGEKQQYPLWLINAALTIAILACVLFWLRRVSCGVPMDVPYEERPDCEIDSLLTMISICLWCFGPKVSMRVKTA